MTTHQNERMEPHETRPQRIEPLASLPVFLDLAGKRVVVAGDGDGALWKAELLAAAGAYVVVFAPSPSPELEALAGDPPAGRVAIEKRGWRADDLAGAVIAVGALEGAQASAFGAAAAARGIPVNVVDTPEHSSFSFGTIINRAPITIAIGTAGSAPVLAQAIRARLEAMLHPVLGSWGRAAQTMRERIKARVGMGPQRREIWRRFAERALAAREAPTEAELADIVAHEPRRGGSIALVGAGPGDPGLLTLKALRELQAADVVLHDRLVSVEILDMARREARRILVGKAVGAPSCRQDEINDLMVRLAAEGLRVVRLKGGDPLLFGRAAEEIAAARAAGIPIEVVPGITAAFGAAAELMMPLTDRRFARRLQLVTGHSEHGRAPDHDWRGLADPSTTTVFYMGSRTFADMLPRMLEAGLDPATPVVAVAAATTARSRRIRATAGEIAARLGELDQKAPCLIVMGGAVAAAEVSSTPLAEANG